MNKTIAQTRDGLLITTEILADGSQKTTRYFDSSRQMILDILEETPSKQILTRFQPDGHRISSIEIKTELNTSIYQGDRKTLISQKETLADGSIQTTHYQKNGKTVDRVCYEGISGICFSIHYQADGVTPNVLTKSGTDGLTQTIFYREDGTTPAVIEDDLADGSLQKTFFRDDGTKEKTIHLHLKGLPANTIRETCFDETGTKVISMEDKQK